MKVRAEPKLDEAANALGDAPETEFTFLLMPVETYGLLAEQAGIEETSVGSVLQKAILHYLRAFHKVDQPSEQSRSDVAPQPDMVVRRKKRSL